MNSPGRLVGIDYLRAFFSVCVVAVHLGYVFPSEISRSSEYESHQFGWSDFINFYVLCLAVPVFMLISTYLYSLKPTTGAGLRRRLTRIFRLALFWSVAFMIFFDTGYGAVKSASTEPGRIVFGFFSAANTVYYFFVSLLIITAATHFAMRMTTASVWTQFGVSTAVVAVLPIIHARTGFYFAHHADPLNFLPLAFAGIGLARMEKPSLQLALLMFALGAGSAILDWTVYVDPCFFQVNQFAIPVYSRPSLIFLAVAVMILALRFPPPSNEVVRFMSKHSLGVYCVHPFFVPVRYTLIERMHRPKAAALLEQLHLTEFAYFAVPLIVVVALSYLGSIVVSYFLKDDLIR